MEIDASLELDCVYVESWWDLAIPHPKKEILRLELYKFPVLIL